MKEDWVSVRIKKEDVKDWENFKQVVIQKHGKLHGVLGDEVMDAIKLYLASEGKKIDPQKHTRTDKKNRLKNIMERTIARGYTNEALKQDIEEFIKEEGIRDQRTVDDYFKALIDYGFIQHKIRSIYQIDKSKIPNATL